VISIAMAENAASRRIMEKLGMKLECVFESQGVHLVRYMLERPSGAWRED